MNEGCVGCRKRGYCAEACKWIDEAADGRTRRREPLLSSVIDVGMDRLKDRRPYLDIIHEIMRAKEEARARWWRAVTEIEDTMIKAIAAMLLADIPITSIARLLQISRSTIYRKINNLPNQTCDDTTENEAN